MFFVINKSISPCDIHLEITDVFGEVEPGMVCMSILLESNQYHGRDGCREKKCVLYM